MFTAYPFIFPPFPHAYPGYISDHQTVTPPTLPIPTHHQVDWRKFQRLANELITTAKVSDLCCIRLDLYLSPQLSTTVTYPQFADWTNKLRDRIRTKQTHYEGLAWYCQVVEKTDTTGFHLHLLVCYRWRCTRFPLERLKAISAEWEAIVSDTYQGTKQTHFHYTLLRTNEHEHWLKLPAALVRAEQWHHPQLRNLFYCLSYFTKPDEAADLQGTRRLRSFYGPYYHVTYTDHRSAVIETVEKLKRARQYHLGLHLAPIQTLRHVLPPGSYWYELYETTPNILGPQDPTFALDDDEEVLTTYCWLTYRSAYWPNTSVYLGLHHTPPKHGGLTRLFDQDDWTRLFEHWKTLPTYDTELIHYWTPLDPAYSHYSPSIMSF